MPELSSGRDLVIHMSVLRAAFAICDFLSGAYLGNRMTYLDDIWYVGVVRATMYYIVVSLAFCGELLIFAFS